MSSIFFSIVFVLCTNTPLPKQHYIKIKLHNFKTDNIKDVCLCDWEEWSNKSVDEKTTAINNRTGQISFENVCEDVISCDVTDMKFLDRQGFFMMLRLRNNSFVVCANLFFVRNQLVSRRKHDHFFRDSLSLANSELNQKAHCDNIPKITVGKVKVRQTHINRENDYHPTRNKRNMNSAGSLDSIKRLGSTTDEHVGNEFYGAHDNKSTSLADFRGNISSYSKTDVDGQKTFSRFGSSPSASSSSFCDSGICSSNSASSSSFAYSDHDMSNGNLSFKRSSHSVESMMIVEENLNDDMLPSEIKQDFESKNDNVVTNADKLVIVSANSEIKGDSYEQTVAHVLEHLESATDELNIGADGFCLDTEMDVFEKQNGCAECDQRGCIFCSVVLNEAVDVASTPAIASVESREGINIPCSETLPEHTFLDKAESATSATRSPDMVDFGTYVQSLQDNNDHVKNSNGSINGEKKLIESNATVDNDSNPGNNSTKETISILKSWTITISTIFLVTVSSICIVRYIKPKIQN